MRTLFKILVVAVIAVIAVTVASTILVAAWMGSLTIGPIDIGELTLTDLDFTVGDASTGRIIVQVTNTETRNLDVAFVRVNGETVSNWTSETSNIVPAGASETFTITHAVAAETQYNVKLLHREGTMVGNYTATA